MSVASELSKALAEETACLPENAAVSANAGAEIVISVSIDVAKASFFMMSLPCSVVLDCERIASGRRRCVPMLIWACSPPTPTKFGFRVQARCVRCRHGLADVRVTLDCRMWARDLDDATGPRINGEPESMQLYNCRDQVQAKT